MKTFNRPVDSEADAARRAHVRENPEALERLIACALAVSEVLNGHADPIAAWLVRSVPDFELGVTWPGEDIPRSMTAASVRRIQRLATRERRALYAAIGLEVTP